MFTVLWKTPEGEEDIFAAASVTKIPALKKPDKDADCHGREHVAFHHFTPVQNKETLQLTRTVIDCGSVFVMNGDGQTVATYRFWPRAAA